MQYKAFDQLNPEMKNIKGPYGQVRISFFENKVYFLAIDVVSILQFEDFKNTVRKYCIFPIKQMVIDSNGRYNDLEMIDECDLVRLIDKSSRIDACNFKTWVFNYAIPAIKQPIGKYIYGSSEQIDGVKSITCGVIDDLDEQCQGEMVLATNVDDELYTTTKACKMLNLNRDKVFQFLRAKKYVCKNKAEATTIGIRCGLFKQVRNGRYSTMMITLKGMAFLKEYEDLLR